jgi:hypothetical protein
MKPYKLLIEMSLIRETILRGKLWEFLALSEKAFRGFNAVMISPLKI